MKDADRESGRERPILFSGRLVRAILEGRKSVTRRVVKYTAALGEPATWNAETVAHWHDDITRFCPYGAPGDRLWVRESWQAVRMGDPVLVGQPRGIYPVDPSPERRILYRATDDDGLTEQGFKWRPSIHMPRWASRISLEVTEVRVERLNDMTADEAKAEGVPSRGIPEPCIASALMYLEDFARLWDELNAPRGYGWDANPWVWVIRFRVLHPDSGRAPHEGSER